MSLSKATRNHVAMTVFLAALGTAVVIATAHAQAIKSKEEIARVVTIEKLNIRDGVVSGEAFNRSPNTLRDVQLFIRYTWLWDDEFKPGKTDPGTSTYYTLSKEIPPDGRLPFIFKPEPPLPAITGGHYEITATIAGFTEVIPQKQ